MYRNRIACLVAALSVLSALALAASPALAQVNLRFTPADTTLAVGESCRLSVVIDDPAVAVRTIDVTVTSDDPAVRVLGGGAGSLYTTSGIYTFQGYEQPEPGVWHGYAILMGANLSLHGPGGLFYWNLEAMADGLAHISSVSVYVSMTDGSWYQTVLLPAAVVRVGSFPSTTPNEVPSAAPAPFVVPNPFNPGTLLQCDLPRAGMTTVTVHDLRGARVASLYSGTAVAGPLDLAWDGRDDHGRLAPAGNYLFVIEAPGLRRVARGVLVK